MAVIKKVIQKYCLRDDFKDQIICFLIIFLMSLKHSMNFG